MNTDEHEQADAPRVIVVGNGPSVLQYEAGEEIDAFDRVVRINSFVTEGLERHTGRRTTDWACSAIIPRRDAECFERIYLCGPTPSWLETCRTRRDTWYPGATLVGPEAVARIGPYARGWPSTGLMAVAHLVEEHGRVTVHGFDGLRPEERVHYFESAVAGRTAHDPDSELGYIERMIEAGRVRRLLPPITRPTAPTVVPARVLRRRYEACASCPQARELDTVVVRCRSAGSRPVGLSSGRCRLLKW